MKSLWVCLFAATVSYAHAQQPTPEQPASALVGRYQIVPSVTTRQDTFLLDTSTGRVWHQIEFPNVGTVWKLIPRADSPADESRYRESNRRE